MKKGSKQTSLTRKNNTTQDYDTVLSEIADLLESARRASARTVNAIMTATYWEIGRRIVEFEQAGKERATYGEQLLRRLSTDLKERFGRGFGLVNWHQMRRFSLEWPDSPILQTLSEESKSSLQHLDTQSDAA